MSNTFACINASVPKSQKIPSSFLCEVFNPNASVSKWANQIVCIKHGKVAYGGTEAIAFSMALCEKNDPNYGKKCFDVLNCMMRVVDEFIGPPTRLNVLCITFALDGLERVFSFANKERRDTVYKEIAVANRLGLRALRDAAAAEAALSQSLQYQISLREEAYVSNISVNFKGNRYLTLNHHAPSARNSINSAGRFGVPAPGFTVCPPDEDGLYICKEYNWQAQALAFADGSAYCTASAADKLGHSMAFELKTNADVGVRFGSGRTYLESRGNAISFNSVYADHPVFASFGFDVLLRQNIFRE